MNKKFSKKQGPFPILCRGHSGGRLAAEAYIRNGINMGIVHKGKKDTYYLNTNNLFIRRIILNAFKYEKQNFISKKYYQRLMRKCIEEYHKNEIHSNEPFGWKLGLTTFTMPVVLDSFPNAKVLHIIRDGRDIMLSRLNSRIEGISDPVNKIMLFGDEKAVDFRGEKLTREIIEKYRNELEMLHWVTSVKYGLQGRKYKNNYLEIRYEDMCFKPVETFSEVFDFLGIQFLESTKEWLKRNARTDRIGKWKALSDEEMKIPLEIGGELLKELGYI